LLLLLAVLAAILWVPSPWNVVLVVAAALFEAAEVWFWIWWSRQREPVVGAETLVGAVALVATPLDPRGQVRVAGELWQARSESLARPGEQVVIRSVEPDLTLVVTPEAGKSPQ
jgi:membrane protein implicated in regulation of membrane protease activity